MPTDVLLERLSASGIYLKLLDKFSFKDERDVYPGYTRPPVRGARTGAGMSLGQVLATAMGLGLGLGLALVAFGWESVARAKGT